MTVTFVLKRSVEAGHTPVNNQLTLGELALNVYDGKIYLKKEIAGIQSIIAFSDDTKLGKLAQNNEWTATNTFGFGSGATAPVVNIYSTPNASTPMGLAIWNGARVGGQYIHLHTQDGTKSVIEANASAPTPFFIINNTAEALAFGTNGIESARISTGGKVLIGTTSELNSIDKLQVDGNVTITGEAALGLTAAVYSSETIAHTTNPTVIDSFRTDKFRSVKYQVQISDGVSFETAEILLVHDGASSYMTTFGNVFTSAESLGNFDAIIMSTTCSLTFMATTATNKTIKFFRSALTV